MAEKPTVDTGKCTGCGTCKDVCPMGVFEIKNKKSKVVKPDDCIACRACEAQCPEECIVVG